MSFWNLSDGAQAAQQTSFESLTDIEPIPSKTVAKAIISEAKWGEYQGDRYIDLTWTIIDGSYKNRKIFQKVRVNDADPKKVDKAKRMLAAIATNAGGGLFALKSEPTSSDLAQHLTMKPMCITLMVWAFEDEQTGETKKGNWVSGISSSSTPTFEPEDAKGPIPPPSAGAIDDDLPF